MASIKSLYYKKIAQDILDDKNNDYKWLNVKLKKHFRIDSLDKINNFFVKPNDCRWWFGNTKKIRYANICKKMPRGNRKDMQRLLEHIINLRITYPLFIPIHPISGYKFEKDITIPGSYQICYKGVVVNKIIQPNQKNKDEEDNKCPICYEEINLNKNYIATICGHKFCSICIFKNFSLGKEQCPLCRADITNDKTIIGSNNDIDDDEIIRSPQPPPRWLFPRTPLQNRNNNITLITPSQETELNPLIDSNEDRIYREDIISIPASNRTITRNSSIVTLHPSLRRNPLFTENDINNIRNGYNQPILTALEEIREYYSNQLDSEYDNTTITVSNFDINSELISSSEMTGILSNLNDSVTNSPVRFYNSDNDATNEIFSDELTNALNNFIGENINNQSQTRNITINSIPRLNLNSRNNTPSPPLTRNREIDNNDFYYFYNETDELEGSISPEPSTPPEPMYQYIVTDISLNDIDNSYNFFNLHDFL